MENATIIKIDDFNFKAKAESDYVTFLKKYLSSDSDALLWVLAYSAYVHAIDDIVDEDNTNKEFLLRTFEMAAVVYSNNFYIRNIHLLYPLVVTASNTYMDSVIFEEYKDTSHKAMALFDSLRQNGNELILMVIQIVNGIEARRKASIELRDISWRNHHTPAGNPI